MSATFHREVHAITFDVGGTLIEPWPSVGHVYADVAGEHGVAGLSPDDMNKRFMSAWMRLDCRAESRGDWAAIVRETFQGLGPFMNPDALFEALYARFLEPDAWHVFDDVVPTLEALQQRQIPLGIVSNWDERLRPLLDRLRLSDFFEVRVVSCEAGCRKPDPDIFQRAAEGFKLLPGQILHVGDSLEQDLQGAGRAGLQAVAIRRDVPPADPNWISNLNELMPKL